MNANNATKLRVLRMPKKFFNKGKVDVTPSELALLRFGMIAPVCHRLKDVDFSRVKKAIEKAEKKQKREKLLDPHAYVYHLLKDYIPGIWILNNSL